MGTFTRTLDEAEFGSVSRRRTGWVIPPTTSSQSSPAADDSSSGIEEICLERSAEQVTERVGEILRLHPTLEFSEELRSKGFLSQRVGIINGRDGREDFMREMIEPAPEIAAIIKEGTGSL